MRLLVAAAVLVIFCAGVLLGRYFSPAARKIRDLRQQVQELRHMLAEARRSVLPLQQRIAAMERQIDNQPMRAEPDEAGFEPSGSEAAEFRKKLSLSKEE